MKVGFQINVDVKDRVCLVVGGGDEAAEKVGRLLEAGAKVTVISPKLSVELKSLAAAAKILHKGRTFKLSDLEGGVWLVINTVRSDEPLLRDLFTASKQKGFLLCSADQPEQSNFTMPALVVRGPLRIAISTSGVSPALASRLRQEFEPYFDERFEMFLEYLDAYRVHLHSTEPDAEKRHGLLRDLASKVKIQMKISFPNIGKQTEEKKGT